MAGDFCMRSQNEVRGPFSVDRLTELAASGRLKPGHEVSADQRNWISASRLPGVGFEVPAKPQRTDKQGDAAGTAASRVESVLAANGGEGISTLSMAHEEMSLVGPGYRWCVFIVVTAGLGFLVYIPWLILRGARLRQFVVGVDASNLLMVTVDSHFMERHVDRLDVRTVKTSGMRDVLSAYRVRLTGKSPGGKRVRYNLLLPKKLRGIPNQKERAIALYRSLKEL